jgi:uncharacterized membrane protein (DUF2068 family)
MPRPSSSPTPPVPLSDGLPRALYAEHRGSRGAAPHDRAIILLIAVFKLAKGLLLVAAGIGALKLLRHDVASSVAHWVAVLRVDPDNRHINRLVTWLLAVNRRKLEEISAGTFFYASLFLTEGTGLAFGKRWAEYFTSIVTGSFIPLEIYELIHHFSVAKLAVVAINGAVVWYLVGRLKGGPSRPRQFGTIPRQPK